MKRDENRSMARCPNCWQKATVETCRVMRFETTPEGRKEVWFLRTTYRCYSNARIRCRPTIQDEPLGDQK